MSGARTPAAAAEVVDLVSSSEDEGDERRPPRDVKPKHGKRALEVLSPYSVHSGRLAKKGSGKKVHPADSGHCEGQTSRGLRTRGLPCAKACGQNDPVASIQNSRAARSHPVPFMFINADGSDDAIVTDGIMPLVLKQKMPLVATCAGGTIRDAGPESLQSQIATHVLHVQQNDKWSCGFRNLQMMLSALVPHLSEGHGYFDVVPDSLKRYEVPSGATIPTPLPSLRQLQLFLEDSWAAGFDPRGAQHYNRRIVGKKSEIGAVEVSCCLSFLNIDSTVVQFIRCKKSRSLLGRFVWAYFTKAIGYEGCNFCHNSKSRGDDTSSVQPPSTNECALELLRLSALPHWDDSSDRGPCSCPVLPLYLQWEGHSVTVVGAEKFASSNGSETEINLLLFDPMADGMQLKKVLTHAVSSSATENSKTRNKFLPRIRLPAHKLLEKDCQILMCSMRSLKLSEKLSRKNINAVTAAKSEVVRFL